MVEKLIRNKDLKITKAKEIKSITKNNESKIKSKIN